MFLRILDLGGAFRVSPNVISDGYLVKNMLESIREASIIPSQRRVSPRFAIRQACATAGFISRIAYHTSSPGAI